jgi:hypothetical protein
MIYLVQKEVDEKVENVMSTSDKDRAREIATKVNGYVIVLSGSEMWFNN